MAYPNTYDPDTHPLLLVLPDMVSALVDFYMYPASLLVHDMIVRPLKKSAIVVVINSLLIYDYVGGWEDVNPDPDEVRTLSILCSLVLWLQINVSHGSVRNSTVRNKTVRN